MTKEEIINIAWNIFPISDREKNEAYIELLVHFAQAIVEKERASNHAYIYELERDLEVAQDKINDCLVCLNFNPLEAAQDKIKGCLGILNYNPRGKK